MATKSKKIFRKPGSVFSKDACIRQSLQGTVNFGRELTKTTVSNIVARCNTDRATVCRLAKEYGLSCPGLVPSRKGGNFEDAIVPRVRPVNQTNSPIFFPFHFNLGIAP